MRALSLLFLLLLALPAVAQDPPSCPSTTTIGGVTLDAAVDKTHQPLSQPGAMGGDVTCVKRPFDQGVEQFFLEVLPPQAGGAIDLTYLQGRTDLSLRLEATGARFTLSQCAPLADGGLSCTTDLGLGAQVLMRRDFSAGGELTSLRFYLPETAPILRQVLAERPTETGGEGLSVEAFVAGSERAFPLRRQQLGGAWYHVLEGQAALAVMTALVPSPVDLTFRVQALAQAAAQSPVQGPAQTRELTLSQASLALILAPAMRLEALTYQRLIRGKP